MGKDIGPHLCPRARRLRHSAATGSLSSRDPRLANGWSFLALRHVLEPGTAGLPPCAPACPSLRTTSIEPVLRFRIRGDRR